MPEHTASLGALHSLLSPPLAEAVLGTTKEVLGLPRILGFPRISLGFPRILLKSDLDLISIWIWLDFDLICIWI